MIEQTSDKKLTKASLKSAILAKGTKYPLINDGKHDVNYYIYDEIKGTYYFLFENKSSKTIECEANFDLENMKLEHPSSFSKNSCKLTLKPMQN